MQYLRNKFLRILGSDKIKCEICGKKFKKEGTLDEGRTKICSYSCAKSYLDNRKKAEGKVEDVGGWGIDSGSMSE